MSRVPEFKINTGELEPIELQVPGGAPLFDYEQVEPELEMSGENGQTLDEEIAQLLDGQPQGTLIWRNAVTGPNGETVVAPLFEYPDVEHHDFLRTVEDVENEKRAERAQRLTDSANALAEDVWGDYCDIATHQEVRQTLELTDIVEEVDGEELDVAATHLLEGTPAGMIVLPEISHPVELRQTMVHRLVDRLVEMKQVLSQQHGGIVDTAQHELKEWGTVEIDQAWESVTDSDEIDEEMLALAEEACLAAGPKPRPEVVYELPYKLIDYEDAKKMLREAGRRRKHLEKEIMAHTPGLLDDTSIITQMVMTRFVYEELSPLHDFHNKHLAKDPTLRELGFSPESHFRQVYELFCARMEMAESTEGRDINLWYKGLTSIKGVNPLCLDKLKDRVADYVHERLKEAKRGGGDG